MNMRERHISEPFYIYGLDRTVIRHGQRTHQQRTRHLVVTAARWRAAGHADLIADPLYILNRPILARVPPHLFDSGNDALQVLSAEGKPERRTRLTDFVGHGAPRTVNL